MGGGLEENVSEIRELTASDFDAMVDIVWNAYPGRKIDTAEEKAQLKQRMLKAHEELPGVRFHGLFRDGELLGGARFYDFQMNFLQVRMPAGGGGEMGVDLLHKKEHVAKEIVLYMLRRYRERGVPLTIIYPFRPDFYRKMGFGCVTKMNQYRVDPKALPREGDKVHVRYVGASDVQPLLDCYHRVLDRIHGLIEKSAYEIERMMENPKLRIVGYDDAEGRIGGYIVFAFERGKHFLHNDIHVYEFVHETREALAALMTFLHTQADQVARVVFDTQDEYFHFLLWDPRNDSGAMIPTVYHESNVQGVGLMYRVSDVPRMFELLAERDFGGQTCQLELIIDDNFLPENAGSTYLRFEEGRVRLVDGPDRDVTVSMDVADFSSLLAGAVTFRRLYQYSLAEISDVGYLDVLDRIFAVAEKPVCMTGF
ncbi:MAG TPA: GNAT family N-acetyltransferase [Chloroflexi bacterium]|nr:GNAT family N-acetyltransferase [Chloroflexota bacterium]